MFATNGVKDFGKAGTGLKEEELEGEPYISLTRLTSEGKWVVSVSHI